MQQSCFLFVAASLGALVHFFNNVNCNQQLLRKHVDITAEQRKNNAITPGIILCRLLIQFSLQKQSEKLSRQILKTSKPVLSQRDLYFVRQKMLNYTSVIALVRSV